MAITTTSVGSFVNNQINAYRGLAKKATGAGETDSQDSGVVAALKQFFYKLDFLLKYGHFPSVEDTEKALPKELRELKTFLENPQNVGERYILQKDVNTRYCFTYADIGTITVAEESRFWEQDKGMTPGKLGAWTESGEFVWQEDQSSQSCDLNAFLIETLQDTKRADILDSLKTIEACLPSCSDRLVFTTVSESMTAYRLPPSLSENLDVDLIIAGDKNNQVAGYLRHKGVDLKIDEKTLESVADILDMSVADMSAILNSLKTIEACLPSCSDRLVFTSVNAHMTTCRLPPLLSENLDVDLIIAEDKNNQVAGYLRHKGVDLKIDEKTLVSVFRSQVDGILDGIQYTSSPKLFRWHDNTDISERNVDKFFPLNFKGRQLAITAALNAPYKYINIYPTVGNGGYAHFNSLYGDLNRAHGVHLFFNGIDVSSHMEQILVELLQDIKDVNKAPAIKPLPPQSIERLMSYLDNDEMLDELQKKTIQNILNKPQFASAMSAATSQLHGNLMMYPMEDFYARSLDCIAGVSSQDKRAAEQKGKEPTLNWERLRETEMYVYINMNGDPGKLAVKSTCIKPYFVPKGIGAIATSAIFDVTSNYAKATLDMMNLGLQPTITGCITTS